MGTVDDSAVTFRRIVYDDKKLAPMAFVKTFSQGCHGITVSMEWIGSNHPALKQPALEQRAQFVDLVIHQPAVIIFLRQLLCLSGTAALFIDGPQFRSPLWRVTKVV